MEIDNKVSLKKSPADLPGLLTDLTTTLSKYSQNLEKQNAATESLTEAIKQLDTTIKKANRMDTQVVSLQLKQVLVSFVEHYINPQFYHNHEYARLTSAPKIKRARLTQGRP